MHNTPKKFIQDAENIVKEKLHDEQFGVSQLAEQMNMSRSSLLRKIKQERDLSASQFIRQIRLKKGKELLEQSELSVSEIAYQVGFGNNSYFIKCFREHYGFSPGESRKRAVEPQTEEAPVEEEVSKEEAKEAEKEYGLLKYGLAALMLIALIFFIIRGPFPRIGSSGLDPEKSIAVLPFKNLSTDSANLYFVDGLMESTLNKLQTIKDLRVISRTSVERYRNTDKSIQEIAEDLDVQYIIEGSGQRVNNQILLSIQLIDAKKDSPVWTNQYEYKLVDIFALQNAVAKKIAQAIQAKITPEELIKLEKKPTENTVAYDVYFKGLEQLNIRSTESLFKGIEYFEEAIEIDPEFALAYSKLALSYFWLDEFKTDKSYTDIINVNADKALLYDSRSDHSLIAKALYYVHNREFELAIPHLEKALEYNPNSSSVTLMLADLYHKAIPNTEKYLEYALKGIQLDNGSKDSVSQSYVYLQLSNALLQNGFINQAEDYIQRSLNHFPQNYYAPLVKVYIDFVKNEDFDQAIDYLVQELEKDSTRMDFLAEIGQLYYFQEKYELAFPYYQRLDALRKQQNLDIYKEENLKLAVCYRSMGLTEEAARFFESYSEVCDQNKSLYKPLLLGSKYAYEGNYEKAIEQYKLFPNEGNFPFPILKFMDKDPITAPFRDDPDFIQAIKKIEKRFFEDQAELELKLTKKDLL
jgi:TolB-like protein/AraC-like DNA-binding protein/Tfp pilus assembly protein PilF